MAKYYLIGLVIIGIIAVSIFMADKEKPVTNQIIDVDIVAENPQNFKEKISISGTIKEISDDGSHLMLGCEDACVLMPVRYDGDAPSPGENVIVQGKVQTDENAKYVFVATKIEKKQ
jgi:cytochrome c-type biogenesis protein CcmE